MRETVNRSTVKIRKHCITLKKVLNFVHTVTSSLLVSQVAAIE